MIQNFIIDGEVYTAKIWREQEIYYAKCPEIGIISEGKTSKTARLHLIDATKSYLEDTLLLTEEE